MSAAAASGVFYRLDLALSRQGSQSLVHVMSAADCSRNPLRRATTYCIVPSDLASRLHEALRRHFRDDASVEVVVERRGSERRADSDRRVEPAAAGQRRRIKGALGRRVADRRAASAVGESRQLPARVQPYADRLRFVSRREPTRLEAEDRDSARLITRFQAGEPKVFDTLYLRYFDRVYSYVVVVLRNPHEAEDVTQQVFLKAFDALPRYERRSQPFRAWLFTIVRNEAITQLGRIGRLELMPPETANEQRAGRDVVELGAASLSWVSDRGLLLFVERLPLAQRQVLLLRFVLELETSEIASVLDRSEDDVRQLQSRALTFLRARLTAVARSGGRTVRMPGTARARGSTAR